MGFVYQFLGGLLILAGLSVVWTPIPLGIVLIALGSTVILANSEAARGWVRARRTASVKFDGFLDRAEAALPESLSRILAATRPLNPRD